MQVSNHTSNKMVIKKQIRKPLKKKRKVHIIPHNQDTNEQQRSDSVATSDENMKYLLSRYQGYFINKKHNQGLPQVSAEIIPKFMISSEGMQLFGDLQITADGILRQYSALSSVCFGFSQLQGESIQLLRDCNIVDLSFRSGLSLPTCSIDQAVGFLYHVPNSTDLSMLLKQIDVKVNEIKQQLGSIQISDEFLKAKERQFREFKKMCMEYLKTKYTKESIDYSLDQNDLEVEGNVDSNSNYGLFKDKKYLQPNQRSPDNRIDNMEGHRSPKNIINKPNQPLKMFSYAIGRLSCEDKDIQIVNVGYSKRYLDFLGLDISSLTSIALRQKKIDLIHQRSDITDISANDLLNRMILSQNTQFKSNIVTFDGFQIEISQQTQNIQLPVIPNEYGKTTINCEYLFIITEIDVDAYDLQNLLEQRWQLASQPNSLSMDNFIKRELSYKFEDVEYSVQSESFLSRFYENNLKELREMEVEKQQQKIQGVSNYRILKKEEIDKVIDEV